VSNLETAPPELAVTSAPARAAEYGLRLLRPREVPLGGPRAMLVRRTLPQRARSLVGAWCFADHYGPADVSATGGMRVAGHPHTELQTVSWLFQGEVEHRDTLGTRALVRPGELNLMTAGAGIAHSEYSTPATSVLHGVQLWLALPSPHRSAAPRFEHYVPPAIDTHGARVLVFLGNLAGQVSPVTTFTPLLGAEVTLPAGRAAEFRVEEAFEHAVLVDTGRVRVGHLPADPGDMVYQPVGHSTIRLSADDGEGARVLLLGGAPLGERIVMWWNFIGRSHEDIAAYRTRWQAQRAAPEHRQPFGTFPGEWVHTLPAPQLPGARLRPRG
jgi:redox-sensitive bicupin YhaK (pirin superfamily)